MLEDDSFIKTHTNPFCHKLWHLFKRSLKFFKLATFGLKNTKGKMILRSSLLSQIVNRKNDLILIMTPEKQDKTLELSKHWSADSTPARNEVIMKSTYPVKSVK